MQNKITERICTDIFLDNVKRYLEHIEDIQLAMQLARLGIINPKLIDLQTLTNLTVLQFENIKTSIWLEGNLIYFILSIPIEFNKYKRIKVIPMPDENNEELVLDEKIDYVANLNVVYQLLDNKVIAIGDEFIKNLLNNNKTNCQYKENKESSFLYFVEPNIIVTKKLNATEINQNCNDLNIKLKGNNIIRLNNCKVKINNFEVIVKQKIEDQNILPAVKDLKNLVKQNISLPKLKKHIDIINTNTNNYFISLLTFILIILLVILGLCIRFKKNIFVKKTN